MKGIDVVERALSLLNYTDPRGRTDGRQTVELYGRGLDILNTILADLLYLRRLPFVQMKDLNEELPLEDRTVMGVMVYGVAMLMAQSENDGDNQQLMAMLYNSRRNAVPTENGQKRDAIPFPRE